MIVSFVTPHNRSYFVGKLIKKATKRRQIDTDRLTGYTSITVILLSCTDPDMVMLLPFKPEAYEVSQSSNQPNACPHFV